MTRSTGSPTTMGLTTPTNAARKSQSYPRPQRLRDRTHTRVQVATNQRCAPMRIRDPQSEGEEPYNLVPLTDMVFNLLIFFMCATTFAQVEKELSVQLPQATSTFKPLSAAPEQIIINVKEDGSAIVSGQPYD